MSLHSDIMGQSGGELLFDTNGDPATYVPKDDDADPVSLTAVLGDIRTVERNTPNGKVKVQTREARIWASVHATYGGVVTPTLHASLSIAGELWSITGFAAKSSTFWNLQLERTSQRLKTREQTFSNS